MSRSNRSAWSDMDGRPSTISLSPAQSGNPRGRPKGRENFTTIIRQGPEQKNNGTRQKRPSHAV